MCQWRPEHLHTRPGRDITWAPPQLCSEIGVGAGSGQRLGGGSRYFQVCEGRGPSQSWREQGCLGLQPWLDRCSCAQGLGSRPCNSEGGWGFHLSCNSERGGASAYWLHGASSTSPTFLIAASIMAVAAPAGLPLPLIAHFSLY